MPQREDLDGRLWFFDNPIVQVVWDPSEMHAPDAREHPVAGAGAEVWVQSEKRVACVRSSLNACGAFGRLAGHQSFAMRICSAASWLTTIGRDPLNRRCASRIE